MKKILMRMLFLLILLIPGQVFARAPECPLFSNKRDCLEDVDKDYKDLLEYIEKEYDKEGQEEMIQAAVDIRHFESLACAKTCLN